MKKNITVVKVGHYTHLAFEDQQAALDLFALLGQGVQVTDSVYNQPKEFNFSYALAESDDAFSLKLVSEQAVCGTHTIPELQKQVKDREDLEQRMNERNGPLELAAPLPAEVPTPPVDDPF